MAYVYSQELQGNCFATLGSVANYETGIIGIEGCDLLSNYILLLCGKLPNNNLISVCDVNNAILCEAIGFYAVLVKNDVIDKDRLAQEIVIFSDKSSMGLYSELNTFSCKKVEAKLIKSRRNTDKSTKQ